MASTVDDSTIQYDDQIVAATSAASAEAGWETLGQNYFSNTPNDFSSGVINALKSEGLTDSNIADIIAEIIRFVEGEGGEEEEAEK